MLQQRLFNLLQRRSIINVASTNKFLQISKNGIHNETRGIRHKANKGSTSSSSSEDKSSTKNEDKKEYKYEHFDGNKEKFEEEFLKKWQKFVDDYGKELLKNPSKAKFINQATMEFVKNFNEKSSASGFAVEKDENAARRLFLINIISATLAALLLFPILFGDAMSSEHAQILQNETTINLNNFIKNYLNVGEVQAIYYYPYKRLAIAMLQPNAVIDGKTVSSTGVPITLADRMDLDLNPMQFVHLIRDAEYTLGVDQRENVPILIKRTISPARKIIYVLITIMTFLILAAYNRSGRRSNFKIIYSGKKKDKN